MKKRGEGRKGEKRREERKIRGESREEEKRKTILTVLKKKKNLLALISMLLDVASVVSAKKLVLRTRSNFLETMNWRSRREKKPFMTSIT